MQTIAHRTSRLPGRASHKLTMWLVGATLVAAIAVTLALSLGGSAGQRVDPSADTPQATPQGPTPAGGHRTN